MKLILFIRLIAASIQAEGLVAAVGADHAQLSGAPIRADGAGSIVVVLNLLHALARLVAQAEQDNPARSPS